MVMLQEVGGATTTDAQVGYSIAWHIVLEMFDKIISKVKPVKTFE